MNEKLKKQMQIVSGKGFELLAINSLKYNEECIIKCPKGHLIKTTWRSINEKLSRETFCQNCFMLNKMNARANEKGYRLISDEWNGYMEEYEFICPNNHKQTYNWKYFNGHEGNHCMECYNQRILNGEHNATSEEFKQLQTKKLLARMAELGYTLDQEEYRYSNNQDKIKMICDRNHKYTADFSHFMLGKKCRTCAYENQRLSEDELKNELDSMGYTYLGEYTGINEPLKYICTCGHITRKRMEDIRRGQKCIRCAYKKSIVKRREERVKLLIKHFGK